jgi:hydrogenase maturation protease
VLIIGCGNPDRGDDAAGLLVARRLRELGIPASEHTGEALALLELWQGAEEVLLIDAVVSGAAPGTVTVWDLNDAPRSAGVGPGSTHGFGIAEALTLARALDLLPPRLRIYGIEGRQFELGSPPDGAVAAAAERLAQRIARGLTSAFSDI